jgi:glycosyltransferase involved in cell wall biosynthesis
LRIVFYDRTPVDYTAETPFRAPLGGSESAQVYLAIEIARLGHEVALVSNTSAPGRYLGVDCSNHRAAGTAALLNSADVIVNSNEALGRWLRDNLRVTRPMVLWIQHAHDQPAIRGLESSRERKIWNGYAFVSQWQLKNFVDVFWVPAERSKVMRNAVSPSFASLPLAEPWFVGDEAPVLVYTSQPYRGLDVLLDAIPAIRSACPGTRLRVFSGFAATYGTPLDQDPHAPLYRRCLATEGVEYPGPIAQPALARELASAPALAYPSTFAETSCIAALEAMAAGSVVLTTRLGALPETTAGFARMIDYLPDKAKLAGAFAELVIAALQELRRDPDTALARRNAQISYVRQNYTWPARALEWQSWLTEIARGHTG